jgi:hypothetical protein
VSQKCADSTQALEHTVNGGVTWNSVALSDDVGAVLAVRARTNALSVLVGVGADCTPAVRTSTDNGVTWKAGVPGAAGAGIAGAGLVLSTGLTPSPCADPVDAFQGTYTAAVACGDVLQWRSGTRGWVRVPVSGVLSIADNGDAYTLARSGAADCAGVEVASLPAVGVTSATKATPIGCSGIRAAGSAALDRAGQNVWLWAGDVVAVSKDGGATW